MRCSNGRANRGFAGSRRGLAQQITSFQQRGDGFTLNRGRLLIAQGFKGREEQASNPSAAKPGENPLAAGSVLGSRRGVFHEVG